MVFPSGLKRICDVSFYMTFASLIGYILGGDNLISTLPFFVFTAFLSAFLAPRGRIKYVSIFPLLLVFVITPLTLINVAILTPIILFIILTLPTPDEEISLFNYDEVFKRFLMIFSIVLLLSIILGGLQSGILLFAISFLLNSIIFMRLIRHDESILRQTSFTIRNAVSIIGVMIGAVLLSMEVFLTFIGQVARFTIVNILGPILEFVLWVLFTILQFIFNIFGLNELLAQIIDGMDEMPDLVGEGGYELFTDVPDQGGTPLIFSIVIAITAIVVIFLLIKVFKMLTSLKPSFANFDVEEERFFLDDEGEKKKRSRRRGNQIREVYRRFLTLIVKQDVNIPLHFNSADVEGLVATNFKSRKSSDLRADYIQVRYGESEYTKDDVRRIRGLYKEVKREIEEVFE